MMTVDTAALLDGATLRVSGLAALDPAEVRRIMVKYSFCRIRGLFGAAEIRAGLESLRRGFDPSLDNPVIGEAPGAVMKNFQKLAIGGTMQSWAYRPRFIRILYNPLWEADIYGLHGLFRKLAALRNRLQGHPEGYAIDTVDGGMWTAARVQHYPAGGGFLIPHRDTVISKVNSDAGIEQFYQILLPLTQKGMDFERGGGFVELEDGEGQRVYIEDNIEAGDVVMYDGRTVHGVADIDPHKRVNLQTMDGRVVMFASLYKDMSGDSRLYAEYDHMEREAKA